MNSKSALGGILVVGGLLALVAAACLVIEPGPPAASPTRPTSSPPPVSTAPAPSAAAATPLPSFTPYAPPTPPPTREARLLVTCNAPVALALLDAHTGAAVAQGDCAPDQEQVWAGLRPGRYTLRYASAALEYTDERPLELSVGDNARELFLPGILVLEPVPAHAELEVDGRFYTGPTRLVYPAVQCPYTATVYVYTPGYQEDGRLLRVEAGVRQVYVLALQPQPTAAPPPAGPTRPPVTAAPPPPATPAPPAWTVDERVALVRQKLYEKANCWRAENGLGPLPYVAEWQALADEHARAWLAYFQQYGPTGFDDSAWRQQFQAAGGDAATSGAGLVLYAPDYYANMAPGARWETFDMCDPAGRMYNYWYDRRLDLQQASGVVVGMAPWWDGDILRAAVTIGVKW